ncbi:MAG: CDP-alcohol phosphatidyltransferase family protein [Candidatus Omnitrophica bacterium]|nr:CDP-alcohol phosphatidyltransferase family protein [Candidatus Omnitrophota bacterium]
MITLANKITLGRMLMVPFFIGSILSYTPVHDHFRYWALAIFLLAFVTDGIDGFVARRYHQKTKLGEILDPLADKLLLISGFICLYQVGADLPNVQIPFWLVAMIVIRDGVLLLGGLLMHFIYKILPRPSTKLGKAATFFQALTVLSVLIQWPGAIFLGYFAGIFTLASGFDYFMQGLQAIPVPFVKEVKVTKRGECS